MQHSSPQTQDMQKQINHVAMKLKHEEVKTEHGQKRTANRISGINFTQKKILITD